MTLVTVSMFHLDNLCRMSALYYIIFMINDHVPSIIETSTLNICFLLYILIANNGTFISGVILSQTDCCNSVLFGSFLELILVTI